MKEPAFRKRNALVRPAITVLICLLLVFFLSGSHYWPVKNLLPPNSQYHVFQPDVLAVLSCLPSPPKYTAQNPIAQTADQADIKALSQSKTTEIPPSSLPDKTLMPWQTKAWYFPLAMVLALLVCLVLWRCLCLAKHCLKKERFLLTAMNNALVDGICVVSNQGRITKVNPAFCTLFGYSEKELLGQYAHDFFAARQVHPSAEEDLGPFFIMLKNRNNFDGIGDFRTKDGVILHIEINIRPIGRHLANSGILITLRDVTEARKRLEHLSQSEERNRKLSSALEHIPVSVLITDLKGMVEYVNPKFIEETGYLAEEIIGGAPKFLESDLLQKDASNQIWQTIHEGKEWKGEVTNKRKNGKITREMISVSPIRDQNGAISHFIAVEEDITERRSMEKDLREQEMIQRTLMESMPVGLMIVDGATRKIELINTFGATMLGRAKEEILGKFCHHVLCPVSQTACPILDLGQSVDNSDRIMVCADGSLMPVLKTVREITFKGENKLLECFIDIQERKRTEEALKEANQQMEEAIDRAEKLTREAEAANRSKSAFLANMSHEIRTPMNAVLGMTHLALNTNLNPQQRNYLEKVDLSAKSLLNILNDILDFSKVEAGRVELEQIPFDINDVFDNLITVIGSQLNGKNIEFVVEVHASTPSFLIGDPLRLSQVLINLSGNAVKFTEQGEIRVSVRAEHFEQQTRLCFEVQDTGVGISAQHKQELFRPFIQEDASTSRRYGGTGLGLSISHHLIRLMGGDIWVDSAPNEGSLFAFDAYFGVQDQPNESLKLPPPLDTWTALVIEGQTTARHVLMEYLHSLHLSTLAALSGQEALELLRNKDASSPVDIIFLATHLPDMEATHFYHTLIADPLITTKPRMILLHPFAYQQEHPEFPLTISKPVTIRQLKATLHSIIDSPDKETPALFSSANHLNFSNTHILLAEDNETNQMVAKEILENAGIVVMLAQNGQEAVELVQTNSFDLVLMDIQMPVMDGFEATTRIRALPGKEHLPIIAMTAYVTQEEHAQIVAVGMDDHIAKPIDISILFSVLSRWLSKGAQAGNSAITNSSAGNDDRNTQPPLAPEQEAESLPHGTLAIPDAGTLHAAINQLTEALQSCKPKRCLEAVHFLQKNFPWPAKYEMMLSQIGSHASNYEFSQAQSLADLIRATANGIEENHE